MSDEQQSESPEQPSGEELPIPVTPHAGILEHFERAIMFHNMSGFVKDARHRFRLLLAGVYSCQAIVELMYEECSDKCVSVTREELKTMLRPLLPGFLLVEKIRIHDFHRFGIAPPIDGGVMQIFMGPMKLKASKGAAVASFPLGEAPDIDTTGNSQVKSQRGLLSVNGAYHDEDADRYGDLATLIREFISAVPAAVAVHEKNRVNGCKGIDIGRLMESRTLDDEPPRPLGEPSE